MDQKHQLYKTTIMSCEVKKTKIKLTYMITIVQKLGEEMTKV